MAEIFDIFKGKESDVKKTFEKKGYDWEKVKVRLEQIEIEKKLDELGNNFENLEANSEAHIQALEDLLGDLEQFKAEKGIIESVKNTAEEKAEKIKNKALEKASEEGKSFIEKYIPGAGKIMDFFEKVSLKVSFAFDKFGEVSEKKGFSAAVGVFFGILSGKIGLNYFKKKGEEAEQGEEENTSNSSLQPTGSLKHNPIKTVSQSVQNNIDIQQEQSKKEKGYSLVGKLYLKKVSASNLLLQGKNDYNAIMGIIEKKNVSFDEIHILFEKLKKNQDIHTLEKVKKELGLEKNTTNIDEFIGILDTIVGENAKFILKNVDINSILNKESFKKSFGNKYEKYKGKSIQEIPFVDSIFFLGYSIPIGIVSGVASFIPDSTELQDSKDIIEKEMSSRKEDFFSKNFIEMIGISSLNSPSFIKDGTLKERIEKEIELEQDITIKKQLKNDLKVFLAFKNSIMTILDTNPSFNLTNDFKINFIDSITAKDLLTLYIGIDGMTNLSNLKGINKVLLYSWIGTLPDDNNIRDKYFKKLIQKSNSEISNNEYLSDEEVSFIGPIFLGEGFNIFIRESAEIASSITTTASTATVEGLKEYGIEVPDIGDNYEYIDYVILGALMGGNFLVYKMPLPLPWKIVIGGAFSAGGATYLYGILEKRGVIDKIIQDQTVPEDVRNTISKLKKEYSGKGGDSDFFDDIQSLFD